MFDPVFYIVGFLPLRLVEIAAKSLVVLHKGISIRFDRGKFSVPMNSAAI